jgi:hypothetical protein
MRPHDRDGPVCRRFPTPAISVRHWLERCERDDLEPMEQLDWKFGRVDRRRGRSFVAGIV